MPDIEKPLPKDPLHGIEALKEAYKDSSETMISNKTKFQNSSAMKVSILKSS
jgi:hypothetical protein